MSDTIRPSSVAIRPTIASKLRAATDSALTCLTRAEWVFRSTRSPFASSTMGCCHGSGAVRRVPSHQRCRLAAGCPLGLGHQAGRRRSLVDVGLGRRLGRSRSLVDVALGAGKVAGIDRNLEHRNPEEREPARTGTRAGLAYLIMIVIRAASRTRGRSRNPAGIRASQFVADHRGTFLVVNP